MDEKHKMTKYEILRQTTHVPRMRGALIVYLFIFQVAFIVLYAFFASYQSNTTKTDQDVPRLYSMFMDVHTMMFVGFGFLMTFLKKYGFSSISFNFLIAAYVLEWALLVRGWIDFGKAGFTLSVENLLVSDFCAAAVLISLGAVLGKTSLTQLLIMATIEVVIQNVNEHIGLHMLGAVDVGESIYVHVFGAYFGLAVAKVLHNKEIESSKESSFYHSDLFSMIGTLFLWLYWPSFNSAVAKDEGQTRAIVNTFLSIIGSTVSTFLFSLIVSKRRLNMVHIQNATLAGGVAVGAIADMAIQPFGALVIGSLAGAISVIGFEYIMPALKRINLHDTCGVHNLHGLPGVMSGITSAIVAALATPELYGGYKRLNTFYPGRFELSAVNTTATNGDMPASDNWVPIRSASVQAGYQMAALAVTLGIAILGGLITGLIMRLPVMETLKDEEIMFDDGLAFITPEDYSFKLSEVKTQTREEEEMLERRATSA